MNVQIGHVIDNGEAFCVINGETIPYPSGSNSNNVTMINNHVFINGYEYKDGQWKRTLRALWHLWF